MHSLDVALPSYAAVIVQNLRAVRVRKGLEQRDLVERMRDLGFTNWHRQTLSRIEQGHRNLLPGELLGLVVALETSWGNLLFPAAGEMRIVGLPNGHPVILPLQHEMPEGLAEPVWWDGNEAKFAGEAGS
jgi:transcriptional regulator with XRE-family HTH domain